MRRTARLELIVHGTRSEEQQLKTFKSLVDAFAEIGAKTKFKMPSEAELKAMFVTVKEVLGSPPDDDAKEGSDSDDSEDGIPPQPEDEAMPPHPEKEAMPPYPEKEAMPPHPEKEAMPPHPVTEAPVPPEMQSTQNEEEKKDEKKEVNETSTEEDDSSKDTEDKTSIPLRPSTEAPRPTPTQH